MQAWKPLLALVPAGLLAGLVAGQATRPVMLVKDDRPWPQSVQEHASRADNWPDFDLAASNSVPRGYSYRPELDYDAYAWPDQADHSAEFLAARYDYGAEAERYDVKDESDLPVTRRAVAELAGNRAERAAAEVVKVGATDQALNDAGSTAQNAQPERAGLVLPPVPPPLAEAGVAPELPDIVDDETS